MEKVFISSTFQDLSEYRTAIREMIRRQGLIDIAMEHLGARDERPKEECLRIIREESDIFIGIYAHRYGYIPPDNGISITESEYIEAITHSIPTLVYLIYDDTPWPPAYVDEGESRRKLNIFKSRLKKQRVCGFFHSADDLSTKISADLARTREQGGAQAFFRGQYHSPPPDWQTPVRNNKEHYKLVIFDLDGTLVKGTKFEFSWEVVWCHLGYAAKIQNKLKTEYRRNAIESSKLARVSAYDNWCNQAVEYFRKRKLSRNILRELARTCILPHNWKQALCTLRSRNIATAIVSGGINTFLEDVMPEYKDYFDFVFINELLFDTQGIICGVIPTAYDFEGKVDALELICDRVMCSADEVVFVGDHFNDEAIMLCVDKSIAFPSNDLLIDAANMVNIASNNLNDVLPEILGSKQ